MNTTRSPEEQDSSLDPVALNQAMIDRMKQDGNLHDSRVETAFRAIPRHLFLPEIEIDKAYQNEAIPTKHQDGQAISSSSQPAMMAIMLEQLKLEPGQRILEIGAGTGYNAALMAHIVGERGRVVTVDIDEDIVANARAHLDAAGVRGVEVVCTDGGEGYPPGAPYDRIILTVGAWDIAPAWSRQLKSNGRLVLPLGIIGGIQKSVAFRRAGDHLESLSAHSCGFMRLRGTFAGPEAMYQLGPEAGLMLSVEDSQSMPTSAEQVYQWLTGPFRDIPTATKIAPSTREIGSVSLWIGLNAPGFCTLYAQDNQAYQVFAPFFWGVPGKWSGAPGILTADGLCLLTREPGDVPDDDAPRNAAPVEVQVRCYGGGESFVSRLIESLAIWNKADRPYLRGMSLKAYPRNAAYRPGTNERVILKRWTQLVLKWTS